jgi:hypothetical protein
MTPIMLQSAIIDSLTALFSGFKLKNRDGVLSGVTFYRQNLPGAVAGAESPIQFPNVLVALSEGDQASETDPPKCKILITFGIWDDAIDYQGFVDCAGMIEKTRQYLLKRCVVDDAFELDFPIGWKLHDEDTYPYFFGALETNWIMPSISRYDLNI